MAILKRIKSVRHTKLRFFLPRYLDYDNGWKKRTAPQKHIRQQGLLA
jgi:hypothetical protein